MPKSEALEILKKKDERIKSYRKRCKDLIRELDFALEQTALISVLTAMDDTKAEEKKEMFEPSTKDKLETLRGNEESLMNDILADIEAARDTIG